MPQIRSCILIFAFGVFGIGAFVFNFLVFPVAKYLLNSEKYKLFASDIIHKLWAFLIKFLEFLKLIKVTVKNPEQIEYIQNKIIVATHPSFIDIVVLMSLIPRSTCFVKNALTRNFLLKNLVNSIFIPNDIDIESLKIESKKYLDSGYNLIIFPMGFRHRENEQPKIKKGASLISLNSGKNIIPIKIKISEDFLFLNQPFYDAGKNVIEFTVEIGKEIDIKKCYDESDVIMKRNITKEITDALYN